MKVLSMTNCRLQDRIDAQRLLTRNPHLDLKRVQANLGLIEARGFHREQDLLGKLNACSPKCVSPERSFDQSALQALSCVNWRAATKLIRPWLIQFSRSGSAARPALTRR